MGELAIDYQEAIEILQEGFEISEQIPHLIETYKTAISAMQDLQEYKKIGTLEEIKDLIEFCEDVFPKAADELGNLIEYRELGDLEEIREAVKLHRTKKPQTNKNWYACPNCGEIRNIRQKHEYCHDCGQHLDWSDT